MPGDLSMGVSEVFGKIQQMSWDGFLWSCRIDEPYFSSELDGIWRLDCVFGLQVGV